MLHNVILNFSIIISSKAKFSLKFPFKYFGKKDVKCQINPLQQCTNENTSYILCGDGWTQQYALFDSHIWNFYYIGRRGIILAMYKLKSYKESSSHWLSNKFQDNLLELPPACLDSLMSDNILPLLIYRYHHQLITYMLSFTRLFPNSFL